MATLSGWLGWRWSITRAEFLARLEDHQGRVHVGVVGDSDRRRVYRVLDWIRPARVFHVDRQWADSWALERPGTILRRYPGWPMESAMAAEAADGPITAVLAFSEGTDLPGSYTL